VAARKAFALRLDAGLHAAIERAAAGDLRSVNAEIEMLLREAMARRGIAMPMPDTARRGRPPVDRSAGNPPPTGFVSDADASGPTG
jgi:hypothetical protein